MFPCISVFCNVFAATIYNNNNNNGRRTNTDECLGDIMHKFLFMKFVFKANNYYIDFIMEANQINSILFCNYCVSAIIYFMINIFYCLH